MSACSSPPSSLCMARPLTISLPQHSCPLTLLPYRLYPCLQVQAYFGPRSWCNPGSLARAEAGRLHQQLPVHLCWAGASICSSRWGPQAAAHARQMQQLLGGESANYGNDHSVQLLLVGFTGCCYSMAVAAEVSPTHSPPFQPDLLT
jgi:hypothetical protein